MLKGGHAILSPELLKVLCENGAWISKRLFGRPILKFFLATMRAENARHGSRGLCVL